MPTLVVPAGRTLVIDGSFTVAVGYDLFQMGDNSTLRVRKDVKLVALEAQFGNNCFIDARGDGAQRGTDADQNPAQIGAQCGEGHRGAPGGRGGRGTDGAAVTIEAGLRKFGNLLIDASGGRGGEGGNGQPGGQGGGALCYRCDGGSGGRGGDGGQGGPGGDGGKIKVKWTPLPLRVGQPSTEETELVLKYHDRLKAEKTRGKKSSVKFTPPLPPGHNYVASGGIGYPGGSGGGAGRGGDGVGCALGSQGGGPPGGPGSPGPQGANGTATPYQIST